MTSTTAASPVQAKIHELCETIVSQPDFQDIRRRVDQFMADEASKTLYKSVVELGDELHQKQHAGEVIDEIAAAAFERDKKALFDNPIAKGFLDAQEEIHQVTQSVNSLVSKTYELGRIPTAEDLDSGSCGSGCGCH